MSVQQQLASQKARKERENVKAYEALIASPATDGSIGLLPAGGRFKLVAKVIKTLGSDALTIVSSVSRTIQSPALQVGESMSVDWIEEGAVVTVEAGFELHVDAGLGQFFKIGEVV